MHFWVLGPVEIGVAEGERHGIGSRNQRAVLAMLLAGVGSVVHVDEIVEAVWGEASPKSANRSLQAYVSRLRGLVGDRLVRRDDGYSLVLEEEDVLDSEVFEREISEGRCGAALRWVRGRPFGDMADLPGVRPETRRLESLVSTARTGQVREQLEAGDLSAAIARAEAILAKEPLNEPVWEVLIRAHGQLGLMAEALRTFQRAAGALAKAGLEPGAALRAAETEILTEPPSRGPSGRRALPLPVSSLIGRASEIEEILATTADRRLTTLIGPGGVGKTRVAVEVGHIAQSRHRFGARLVDLAAVTEADAIGPSIRRALDMSEEELELHDGLGATDALLIVDNCEHLAPAVAEELSRIIVGGDVLRILATSREPLGIPGERRRSLAPLDTSGPDAPAVALFVDRAADVGVEIEQSDPRVTEIVTLLDGLPLALEMAAARLATTGLSDLRDQLADTVVSLGDPARPDRQRTLRGVLEWSAAGLTPELRTALADFSMFAGPVGTRDLAAAVSTDDPHEAVIALASRSLVTVDTTADDRTRYGSLETVRQFGRESLADSGRIDIVARRHATWFVEAAEEAAAVYDSADEAVGNDRIDRILDEVRGAHRWTRRHDPSAAMRLSQALFLPAYQGVRLEVLEWSKALADVLEPDAPGAARLFGQVAAGLMTSGRLLEARTWVDRAVATVQDPERRVEAYPALADLLLYEGRLEEAAEHGRAYLRTTEERGPGIEWAIAVSTVALPLAYLGRTSEALDAIPTDVPADTAPSTRAWLAYTRGEVLLDAEPEAALRDLELAIALAETVSNHFLANVAHVSAASLRARSGSPEQAILPFARTIERLNDRGNVMHLVTTLRNLPTLLARVEAWEPTAQLVTWLSSVSTSPTFGDEATRLTEAENRARAALGPNRFSAAARLVSDWTISQAALNAIGVLRGLSPRDTTYGPKRDVELPIPEIQLNASDRGPSQ